MAKAFDDIFHYCATGSPHFVAVITRGTQEMHYSRNTKSEENSDTIQSVENHFRLDGLVKSDMFESFISKLKGFSQSKREIRPRCIILPIAKVDQNYRYVNGIFSL